MAVANWIVEPKDAEAVALAAALDLHPLAASLLCRRGVTTVEAARRFLHPNLDDLADPLALPGMDRAVERVAAALAAGQHIAVHGDYDVDGISATAILVRGLQALGGDPRWYLPHRFHDGYGLGLRAVEALAAQGAQVLIAADCGITATESVGRARALGCDVLILDHHVPGAERPEATIVAPPRGIGAGAPLCAAGLAFAFVRALRRRLGATPSQPGLVSLAALGTIADVVPLLDDNRRLAAAGLTEMHEAPLVGIRALADVAGIAAVDAWHVGWQLGPRLNAPGRLGDPSPALRLLLTDDAQEARPLADLLDATNRERQAVLGRVLAEALIQAEEDARAPAFVVAGEGWHPGLVGLVAGRLAERYRRPAVAIALDGDVGRGSARSVEGFDLTEALGACAHHLLAFGGHAMAAGLSVMREAVPEFRRAFQERAAAGAEAWAMLPSLRIDAEVRLSEVTPSLVDALERLGPFGAGNPEPLLASRGVRAVNRRLVGGGQHLRMDVTDGEALVEAIGFAMAARGELLLFTEAPIDLAFVPERDRLAPDRVRLRVQALKVPGMDPESILTDTGALLDRLFQHAAEYLDETRGDGIEEAAALYTKVVGVTFAGRQEALAALRPGDPLRLVREPANVHDPHAVGVLAPDGRQLGYLRAPLAGRLSPSIDAGARYRATVLAVTGGGDRSLGVNIF
ncbi:MAG TPA: single-stranded-DNA-specific exonuclease RecJ, partial [bacterium]|nr:single-stranded-DNA-specific exonuclease RecJ [bacterium]